MFMLQTVCGTGSPNCPSTVLTHHARVQAVTTALALIREVEDKPTGPISMTHHIQHTKVNVVVDLEQVKQSPPPIEQQC